MSKVKVDNINELFSQVLNKYGDLIPSADLRETIAQSFIEEVEGYGVTFTIDENKFPEKEMDDTADTKTKEMVDKVIEDRKKPPAEESTLGNSSIHGQNMKSKQSKLLGGIKNVGKNDK